MMAKKGKFIVIEGVDGSGKTTQFNFLSEKLKSFSKNKLLIADFPRYYDSVWGKMVGEFLVGKYGKFNEVDPYLAVLPYMIDQYTWSRDVGKPWLLNGGNILSNRYFTSNAHQIAKLKGKAKSKFRDWVWPAGYKHLGILKPDMVIFLDVHPAVSLKLNKKKEARGYLGKRKYDNAELNRHHQMEAYKEYRRTINNNSYWKRVNCVKKGAVYSPVTIHEKVWDIVKTIL